MITTMLGHSPLTACARSISIRTARQTRFRWRRVGVAPSPCRPIPAELSPSTIAPPSIRVLATTVARRRDVPPSQDLQAGRAREQVVQESIKPESVEKAPESTPAPPAAAAGSKQDALLAEKVTSRQEQRKADWAIIREMSHYLWPKDNLGTRFRVGLSVALLVGAKVRSLSVSVCRVRSYTHSHVGSQCASSFLLQVHCRLDEH